MKAAAAPTKAMKVIKKEKAIKAKNCISSKGH